jgi:hypothetical protein
MKSRHKRHLMGGTKGGAKHPPYVSKSGDGGYGPAEKDSSEGEAGQGTTKPTLVSGNPKVVKAAEEKKSIGEVPGIYAKKRLDRKARPGGISGS